MALPYGTNQTRATVISSCHCEGNFLINSNYQAADFSPLFAVIYDQPLLCFHFLHELLFGCFQFRNSWRTQQQDFRAHKTSGSGSCWSEHETVTWLCCVTAFHTVLKSSSVWKLTVQMFIVASVYNYSYRYFQGLGLASVSLELKSGFFLKTTTAERSFL